MLTDSMTIKNTNTVVFCRHWDQANYNTCFCNTGYDCEKCLQIIGKPFKTWDELKKDY